MTCLELLTSDIDTVIDCEVDCIGCIEKECPDDKRKKERADDISRA